MNTMMRYGFIVFLVLAGLVASVSAQEQDVIIHRVREGDTLGKLAGKYLGDTKFWHELVIFNDLEQNIGPNELPARQEILIPGAIRNKAMNSLEKAREARTRALAAKANDFGKDSFRTAEEAFKSSDRAFANTDYLKSKGFAETADKRYAEAIAVADREAVVSLNVNLVKVLGDVKIQSGSKRTWSPLEADGVMVPGDRIMTGEKSGLILQFRDHSLLKVRSSSEVSLKTYSNDLRTGKTNVEVELDGGTIDGKVNPLRVQDSSFSIQAKGHTFSLPGVAFNLGYRINGEVGIAIFEGEAKVNVSDQEILPVRANKGVLIDAEGKVQISQGLLAAPKLSTPKNNSTQFNQRPELEWLKALGVTQYRVEVSNDIDFSRLVDDVITSKLSVSASILDVGTYYWRVSSVDQNGLVGPAGEVGTFFIKRNLELTLKPSDALLYKGNMPFANVQHQFNIFPVQQENSVDWIEVSVDNGGFKRLEGPIQFNMEGEHSIRYRAVDVRNERQPLSEYKVIVDDTRPMVQIGADSDIYTNMDNRYAPLQRVFMGVAKDELAGIRTVLIRVDDGEFRDYTPDKYRDKGKTSVVSKKLRFPTDGLHTIVIKAQDLAGNWSDVNELKVNIDKTPPEVKIRPAEVVIPGKDLVYVSGRCKFFFDHTDDISGTREVLASVNGSTFSPVGEALPALPAGKHVIQFKAIDNVGNEGIPQSYHLEVDDMTPETRWRTNPQLVKFRGSFYGPRDFMLKFVPQDNLSGIESVEVDINDEMLSGVVKNADGSMKFVREGTYRISYFSIDKVKNVEGQKQIAFTIDITSPQVDVSIAGPKHEGMSKLFISQASTIHINAKDEVSGVNRIELMENGREFIVYQGPITGLQQGVSQLTFRAVDNVGNVSEKKDIRITVDNTPPTVWVDKRNDGSYIIQALDDHSGVHEIYAKVDGGELKRYKDKSALPEGKSVLFWAVDNVGNTTEKIENLLQ